MAILTVAALQMGCSYLRPAPEEAGNTAISGSIQGYLNRKHSERSATEEATAGIAPCGLPILPSPNLELNEGVWQELNLYAQANVAFVRKALERRAEHYELMRQIFIDEGIPLQLLNLALIESGFRSEARSSAGAVGIWQFTRQTGRAYGLLINSEIDQRKDPVRSTLAAAKHLRDLYGMFNDWYLVLAAYNAGVGAVRRAMFKTASSDFWMLVQRNGLSKQTSRFVPRFIAASVLVQALEEGRTPTSKCILAVIRQEDLSGVC